jgi:peptidoglycan-N-acetylglucosamine deacetylase
MADIKIVLTFDDGPSPAPGYTNGVLKTLKAPGDGLGCIKAAFFVQTHAPARMTSAVGLGLVKQAFQEGHVIGIHTGSSEDHRCHKSRVKKPADQLPPPLPQGTNGLDSDMIRAKEAIKQATGATPNYVRATFGYTNDDCMKVYGMRQLKHIYWDVNSGDADSKTNADKIKANLKSEISASIKKGQYNLIVLFHDINRITAVNLAEFISTIKSTAESAPTGRRRADAGTGTVSADAGIISADAGITLADAGTKTATAVASATSDSKNNVLFTTSRSEIENIFDLRTSKGDETSDCPKWSL